MTRYIIGDLLTGLKRVEFEVISGPWSNGIGEAGSVSCTVSTKDPVTRTKNLWNVGSVGLSYLAVIEGDSIMEAGPIWTQDYSKDDRKLTFNAAGMWSYFDHRVLIPVLAAGQSPLDVETYYEGVSLATVAKRLVQQAQQATGGNVPVVLPREIAGSETREYQGADLASVGDALRDLSSTENGPEIDFAPRWNADRSGIEWVLKVGTPTQPELSSPSTHVWDYTVPKPSIKSLTTKKDGSKLSGTSFAMSGSSSLYSIAQSPTLLNQGYPQLDVVDSSFVTDEQATLDSYAREKARVGSKPTEFWSFMVKADVTPKVGQFSKGDYCLIKIKDDDVIPDNTDGYRRRITNLSGDQDGKWVSVTTGEVYSLNG